MAKVVAYKPSGLKLRAIFDNALSTLTGKRMFTRIVTDSSIREALARDRKTRGHRPLVSDVTISDAAAAYRALKANR